MALELGPTPPLILGAPAFNENMDGFVVTLFDIFITDLLDIKA